ncbi:hypothetical protein EMEDMD4_440183 [Sinorhizobium medicae]|uniref:Uncharacterized protein n=1 Tax=Sinorhizobium medicae TaxID=110321 RepID=A0A508WZF1_9HYPH|nr:hypothetical protein EMEDMD4_440183 [Sinorhizobium medicae]
MRHPGCRGHLSFRMHHHRSLYGRTEDVEHRRGRSDRRRSRRRDRPSRGRQCRGTARRGTRGCGHRRSRRRPGRKLHGPTGIRTARSTSGHRRFGHPRRRPHHPEHAVKHHLRDRPRPGDPGILLNARFGCDRAAQIQQDAHRRRRSHGLDGQRVLQSGAVGAACGLRRQLPRQPRRRPAAHVGSRLRHGTAGRLQRQRDRPRPEPPRRNLDRPDQAGLNPVRSFTRGRADFPGGLFPSGNHHAGFATPGRLDTEPRVEVRMQQTRLRRLREWKIELIEKTNQTGGIVFRALVRLACGSSDQARG